jgi:hypothetical protein
MQMSMHSLINQYKKRQIEQDQTKQKPNIQFIFLKKIFL